MKFPVQIADATIMGHTHLKLFYNNQDAYAIQQNKDCMVGVLCDGCGSSPNSEVGATLASQFLVNYCWQYYQEQAFDSKALSKALYDFIVEMSALVVPKNKDAQNTFIRENLLFTIIGFILKPRQNTIQFFHQGDGLIYIDEELMVIDQNNRPDYPAKYVIEGKPYFEFAFLEKEWTNNSHFLIASDGLAAYLDALTEEESGKRAKDLIANDVLYATPIALNQFLVDLVQKKVLRDDTTVIMGRGE